MELTEMDYRTENISIAIAEAMSADLGITLAGYPNPVVVKANAIAVGMLSDMAAICVRATQTIHPSLQAQAQADREALVTRVAAQWGGWVSAEVSGFCQ